jgi:hypothetical protein
MYFQRLFLILFGKILAILIGLVYLRRLSTAWRLILLHVIVAIATETAGRYIGVVLHQFNLWLFNIYWFVELWLLSIPGLMLQHNYRMKRLAPGLLIGNSILWIWGFYKGQMCDNLIVQQCINGIILVAIYFVLLVETMMHTTRVLRSPEFWLSVSTILFFAISTPLHGLMNYLIDTDPVALKKLFKIVMVLNDIRYPLVALALYLYASQQANASKMKTNVL